MRHPHDDLYHDRTWFDALGERLMRRIRRLQPRQRGRLWTVGFAVFAAQCLAWAAGLATQAVLFETVWNQRAAQLLAAGLLLVAARHFLAVTGVSARPSRKLITRTTPVAGSVPADAVNPAARHASRPAPDDSAAAAQTFFRAVREAGINVRIARALYDAGFRSAAQVRACSDTELLATPGIGQATLHKLRLQFGLPQAPEPAQSNAA